MRKHPAVLFRTATGSSRVALNGIRLDLPMIVGPLPYTDGVTMERAYLEAIAAADPAADLHTASLVVVTADAYARHADALRPHAANLMVRLEPNRAAAIRSGQAAELADLLSEARIVELEWSGNLEREVGELLASAPQLIVSVFLRYRGAEHESEFWAALERAVRTDGVAMIHYHSGSEPSYRLTPRIDAFLKARLIRARVQLVSAGGDHDTQSSAATVYESVLLGSNGGSMTHVAGLALLPDLVDVYHGAEAEPRIGALAGRDPVELRTLAINTLTCWQHSILDFLSCMGIDDIQKTSGNTMAITMTEDWIREVDALATPEFGLLNAALNARRVAAEPVPQAVREKYKVSALLREIRSDMPLVHAARVLAHQNANYHLQNTNRNLNADFLEVIYRMAAGQMPSESDFLIESDMGDFSIDTIDLKLTRQSLAWSLERLRRDPTLLDYVSLAVPRGFCARVRCRRARR